MTRLPERIEAGALLLRRWRVEDAELQEQVIGESLEHLRPWMPWIADEPQPLAQRREMIAGWERAWEGGGDVYLAVLHEGAIAGSTGLHRRRGPGALEIGYWLHPAFTGRGIATQVARLLTDASFGVDGIDRVEIRNDIANVRSGAVPQRLGFVLEGTDGPDHVWAMTRAAWRLVSSDG